MNDQQILTKAIERARSNGWPKKFRDEPKKEAIIILEGLEPYNIDSLLFDHSFARAFWGEEEVCGDCGEAKCWEYCPYWSMEVPNWKSKIARMAQEEDRLGYLKQFLSGE